MCAALRVRYLCIVWFALMCVARASSEPSKKHQHTHAHESRALTLTHLFIYRWQKILAARCYTKTRTRPNKNEQTFFIGDLVKLFIYVMIIRCQFFFFFLLLHFVLFFAASPCSLDFAYLLTTSTHTIILRRNGTH